jgi:hypothetical protein
MKVLPHRFCFFGRQRFHMFDERVCHFFGSHIGRCLIPCHKQIVRRFASVHNEVSLLLFNELNTGFFKSLG